MGICQSPLPLSSRFPLLIPKTSHALCTCYQSKSMISFVNEPRRDCRGARIIPMVATINNSTNKTLLLRHVGDFWAAKAVAIGGTLFLGSFPPSTSPEHRHFAPSPRRCRVWILCSPTGTYYAKHLLPRDQHSIPLPRRVSGEKTCKRGGEGRGWLKKRA